MIPLTLTLHAPLSHGDPALNEDTGNFRPLRKQRVVGIGDVPILSGNSIRGVMRRRVMRHFLTAAGMAEDQYSGQPGHWDRIYAALVNGGTLNGSEKSVQTARLRDLRKACPPLSLLGAALYTHMLPGMVSVLDAYPRCAEVASVGLCQPSTTPLADLYGDRHHVRHVDAAVDRSAAGITPMPYTHEVLYPGTVLDGGFLLDPAATDIERDCLAWCVESITQLGGNSGKGMGFVAAAADIGSAQAYADWVSACAPQARKLIEDAIPARSAA